MKMNLESVLESRKREDILPLKSIVLSFAIHLGLLAALYFGARLFVEQKEFSPFISASLVPAKGLPTFSQAVASKKEEVQPKEAEPPKESSVENAVKIPSLDVTKKTKEKPKEESSKKEKTREQDKPSEAVSGDKSGEKYGLPNGSDEGYGVKSGSISSMSVDEFEYTWYSASVAGILSKNWVRSLAPSELRGTRVIARFRIYEDGRIDDIILVKKCDIFALDQEVIRAIQNSSPLPPLPKGFQKKSLVAQYEFVY
jgi:TonB family protein